MSDLTVPLMVTTLLKGLKDEHLKISLSKNTPKTMADLRLQAEKYFNDKVALQEVDEIDLTYLKFEGLAFNHL